MPTLMNQNSQENAEQGLVKIFKRAGSDAIALTIV